MSVWPLSTQFVVMVFATSSRHAPKPGLPTPYWQKAGRPNRFAVDMTASGRRSRSVSGIRFTNTGTSSSSSSAAAPPMPEPTTGASSTSRRSRRSLSSASAVDTVPYLAIRVACDMSESSGKSAMIIPRFASAAIVSTGGR
ncbi:hypothetical protein [Micromonospora sp. NPDC006431]|uniref:hypothetical protein n=1 Tax=Micromonospora sp. NPDC006431 TaxID=3364235 RepID=UPI0036ACFFD7